MIFCLFQTWIFYATQAAKVKFKTDKKSSLSNLIFQNQFVKNQAQINRGDSLSDSFFLVHLAP